MRNDVISANNSIASYPLRSLVRPNFANESWTNEAIHEKWLLLGDH